MIRVLFVCLGNICRSPMAEYLFKHLVKKENLSNKFEIASAATSSEEIGNDMHYGTKRKLIDLGIAYEKHSARKITKEDYSKFDYIIGMEESNIRAIKRIVGEDNQNKIFRLLDFSKFPSDIADPWYTGNFDKTYIDILEGLEAFFKFLKENSKI